MKVIIYEPPNKSKNFFFAERIKTAGEHARMFWSGMYSRYELDCGEECPFLKKIRGMRVNGKE